LEPHVVDENRIRRGADNAPLKRAINLGYVHSDRNGPDLLEQRVVPRVRSDLDVFEVCKRANRLLGEDIKAGVRRGPAYDLHVDLLMRLVEQIEIAVAALFGRRDVGQARGVDFRHERRMDRKGHDDVDQSLAQGVDLIADRKDVRAAEQLDPDFTRARGIDPVYPLFENHHAVLEFRWRTIGDGFEHRFGTGGDRR